MNMLAPPHMASIMMNSILLITPFKSPIFHLQKYLIKNDCAEILEEIASHFSGIYKWSNNVYIDNELPSGFWKNPKVIDAQIQQLLKFYFGQYMGKCLQTSILF
jgi:hypothetical protein